MDERALSRRERQIMDIIYQRGQATAAEVAEALPDPPSYSAVRGLLAILESKGHLTHERDAARRYTYRPTHPRTDAARSALQRVVRTFFDGSVERAVAALLDPSTARLAPAEAERLARLIEDAREEGR